MICNILCIISYILYIWYILDSMYYILRTIYYILYTIYYILQIATCVADEVKPLLPHLNPDDPLSPQLRVDGGELSSKCVIVDHLLDMIAQFFNIRHVSIII